jgi:hypothetical protein
VDALRPLRYDHSTRAVLNYPRLAVAALRGEGEEVRVKVLRGGFVTSKQLFLFIFGFLTLLGCRHGLADTYPESTDLLQELAEKVILEIEEKAAWRFVPGRGGSEKFVKIPWRSGDRQTVAIYLFREEGTNAHLPFGARFEKQLGLALDHSSKFIFVMRDRTNSIT